MTTLYLSEKKCFICGTSRQYPLIDLTLKISGSRDLDGRPSQIQRSLIYMWVQHCISCGYCAPDIATGKPEYSSLIKNPDYNQILMNTNFPTTAISFRCYSYLMEMDQNFSDSAWAQLCGAWVCDDNNFENGSIECRRKALDLFNKAKQSKQSIADSPAEENVLIIDILRRTKQFDEARCMCTNELKNNPADQILDLLEFEMFLIDKGDSDCHNETEAEEFEG